MKNGMLYCELQEISQHVTKDDFERNKGKIIDTVDQVYKIYNIAKRDGLLKLEEVTKSLDDNKYSYLKRLLCVVVEGTSEENTIDIAWTIYSISRWSYIEKLVHLIEMKGALSIQAGDNEFVLIEKLLAMLPEEYASQFLEKRTNNINENLDAKLQALCEGEIALHPNDNNYFLLRLADDILRQLNDKGIQLVLRYVDYCDLELSFKLLSGVAKKHILDNMSEKGQTIIVNDMEFMGPVLIKDTIKSIDKIMAVIIDLSEKGEIIIEQPEAVKGLYCLFSDSSIKKELNKVEENEEINRLKQLLSDFEFRNSRLI